MKKKNIIFVIFCLTAFLTINLSPVNFFVFSQEKQASEEKESSLEDYIEYLEFREVDIKDVLRQLSKQYNLNIIFSESVKGLITVQLHGVTIDEALDSIVTINGFMYTKKGKVIKVTTAAEAEKEGKQTKVFRLNNADAGKLKDTLAKTLSSEGKIEADTRSNALIVTDNVAVISKLEGMIPKLDDTTMQVLIEARFIETTLGTTEKLGIDWNTTISASGSKRPTTWPFNRFGADRQYYPIQEHSISYTPDNTRPVETPTVTYPYLQTDGTVDYTKPVSTTTISYPYQIPQITSSFPVQDVAFPNLPAGIGSFPEVGGDMFSFGALDFSQFKATLDMLKTRGDTKLLSSPRIVTTDNKEASIQVGQTVRIVSQETYDEQTKQTKYTYEKQEVGVILTVTPQVSPDGHVKLKLKPEVSSIVGYNSGTSIPIIDKRTAETEVVIKDGQTIIIGGLVTNEKTYNTTKVPFLGDLPLLGKLFSHKEESPTKSDLLIFVTARVVKENEGSVLAMDSGLKLSPLRPLKLKLRDAVLEGKDKKNK